MRRVGTEKGEARGSGVRSNTVAKALTQTVEKGENRGFSKDSLTGQSEYEKRIKTQQAVCGAVTTHGLACDN